MAMNKNRKLAGMLLVAILLFAGCGRKTAKMGAGLQDNVEPDRVLLERSLEDIEKGRYISARLNLMTLINTYPDSEFLAKAKLAVADSYYKEGGSSGLALAVQEYKDFRTFFPFLEEAAYAQYQVAMCHYRRLEKPDRDRTQARLAEAEFQEFIKKHPDHEWIADAEQKLRNVQEVLAEGDYRIARHYYVKGSYRAAAGRLLELTDRYPLYSNSDRSLMMLGFIFEKAERDDIAGRFYSRVVKDYPLSSLVPDAKARLEEMGVPVPQPDPAALERMQKEVELAKNTSKGFVGRTLDGAFGAFSSRPDTSRASRAGQPNLEPPAENSPTVQSLTPNQNFDVQPVNPATGANPSSAAALTTPPAPNRTDDPGAASGTATADIPQRVDPKTGERKDDKKKNDKESSSKKKKGIRKVIPW
jgi:outer membrane protein assembly factor BamD